MSDRTPVFVYARDPISQTGIVAQLRPRPELAVVEESPDAASVALVVADEVDEETVRVMTALQRNGCPKIVLVATRLDDSLGDRAANLALARERLAVLPGTGSWRCRPSKRRPRSAA